MKGFRILWLLLNGLAVMATLFSIHLSPDTLFEFPYLHLLSIISLFALINLPFYTAYERLRED